MIIDRQRDIAERVAALPLIDISTIRLKARVFMWSEGAVDAEQLGDNFHDVISGPVLASLFRDLLAADADGVLAQKTEEEELL